MAKPRLYLFFREGMFYPLELRDDADAKANAEFNAGTLRVEDINGRIVWQPAWLDMPPEFAPTEASA